MKKDRKKPKYLTDKENLDWLFDPAIAHLPIEVRVDRAIKQRGIDITNPSSTSDRVLTLLWSKLLAGLVAFCFISYVYFIVFGDKVI